MKRSNRPRFRKTGGGPLILRGGKKIQPGETFRVYERDIPQAFRDTVQRVDPKSPHEEEAESPQINLEIHHRGGGWYDLVNKQTSQVINAASMRYKEASQFADMTVEQAQEQLQRATTNGQSHSTNME